MGCRTFGILVAHFQTGIKRFNIINIYLGVSDTEAVSKNTKILMQNEFYFPLGAFLTVRQDNKMFSGFTA